MAELVPEARIQFTASADKARTFSPPPTTIQCSFCEFVAVGARRATSSSASNVSRATGLFLNSRTDRRLFRKPSITAGAGSFLEAGKNSSRGRPV